jgi:aminoglycoside phosphotransferase (APT) family kinase protein
VSERIHDDELDTSEPVVRALLRAQCPQWADFDLSYLNTSGTDNAMWRLRVPAGQDMVVRLPRRARTGTDVEQEVGVLRSIVGGALANVVRTPVVLHAGNPESEFPHPWIVLGWLDGTDAWTQRAAIDGADDDFAIGLADAVRVIGRLSQVPAPHRQAGERGGPIMPLLDRLDRWLVDPQWHAADLIDVAAVRRCADSTREVADAKVAITFVHGDLIPGNLLLTGGRLAAIIDWGSAGYGDPAQDLTPAWAVFDGSSRQIFLEATGGDDATRLRARAFALEQAVGGVLYYTPRRHSLGDVMARTLHRILNAGE